MSKRQCSRVVERFLGGYEYKPTWMYVRQLYSQDIGTESFSTKTEALTEPPCSKGLYLAPIVPGEIPQISSTAPYEIAGLSERD